MTLVLEQPGPNHSPPKTYSEITSQTAPVARDQIASVSTPENERISRFVKDWIDSFSWFEDIQTQRGIPTTGTAKKRHDEFLDLLDRWGTCLIDEIKRRDIDINKLHGFSNEDFEFAFDEMKIHVKYNNNPLTKLEKEWHEQWGFSG